MGYGQNGTLAINFQNSFNGPIVSSNYFIPILSESVVVKKEPLISGDMRGIYDEGDTYEGKNSVEGDIEFEPDNTTLGVFCRAAFGSAAVVTSDDLQTHTFKPRTVDFDRFSAETPLTIIKDLDVAGSDQIFYNCCVSALEFSVANGEFLKVKATIMGGRYTQQDTAAAAYSTDNKWTWDVTSFQLGGSGIPDLQNVTITLDEVLGNKFSMDGTKTPSHTKREGFRVVSVAGTILFSDQDEYQKFIAQSEQGMELYMSTGIEVQSGYAESIKFVAPALRYNTFEPTLNGAGLTEVGFEGSLKYHAGSATAIELTLVNTHTAY